MDPITPQEERAMKDARVMYLLSKGCAMTPPQIERIEQIEARLRREVNPRNGRQQLALIEDFWKQREESLRAFLGPHALEG